MDIFTLQNMQFYIDFVCDLIKLTAMSETLQRTCLWLALYQIPTSYSLKYHQDYDTLTVGFCFKFSQGRRISWPNQGVIWIDFRVQGTANAWLTFQPRAIFSSMINGLDIHFPTASAKHVVQDLLLNTTEIIGNQICLSENIVPEATVFSKVFWIILGSIKWFKISIHWLSQFLQCQKHFWM